MVCELEHLRGNVSLEDDTLDRSRAIAKLKKVNLATGAFVVEPALECDLLPFIFADVTDVDPLRHARPFLDCCVLFRVAL